MLDDFYENKVDSSKHYRVDLGDDGDHYVVKYARNRSYTAAVNKAMSANRRKLDEADPEGYKSQKILAPLVAKHLLVSWKLTASKQAVEANFPEGLITRPVEGNSNALEIVFTVENASKVLSHPRYKPFYLEIKDYANDRLIFEEQEKEEDEKNLEGSLSTNPNTRDQLANT